MKFSGYKCDRCGADTDGYNPLGALPEPFVLVRIANIDDEGKWITEATVDLCESCAVQLGEWWEAPSHV
jgi:hypothetical protein